MVWKLSDTFITYTYIYIPRELVTVFVKCRYLPLKVKCIWYISAVLNGGICKIHIG